MPLPNNQTVSVPYADWFAPSSAFVSAEYPAGLTSEPPLADQRFIDAVAGDDLNDGTSGTPWKSFRHALEQLYASTTWNVLNFSTDITIDNADPDQPGIPANISKFWSGDGPGSLGDFAHIRKDPASGPITLTMNSVCVIDKLSYVVWDGSGINVTGPSIFIIGDNLAAIYNTFRNWIWTMTGLGGDNWSPFRCDSVADYIGQINNKFTGPGLGSFNPGGTDGVNDNTAGIITFRLKNCHMSDNDIRNFPRPLYLKHSNDIGSSPINQIWENNYTVGGQSLMSGRKNGGVLNINNNIFVNGIEIGNRGGADEPEGHDFFNNTIFGNLALDSDSNGFVQNGFYRNNVITGDLNILTGQTTDVNTNTTNYNLYGANAIDYQNDGSVTLATWQSTSVPAGQDVNSLAGAPTFVGGATPSTIAGYALADGSLGENAGNDGADIGVNVLLVGNK